MGNQETICWNTLEKTLWADSERHRHGDIVSPSMVVWEIGKKVSQLSN